jgi:hypothetical protein
MFPGSRDKSGPMWMLVRCAENLKQPITDNSSATLGRRFPRNPHGETECRMHPKMPAHPTFGKGVTEMSIDGWIVLGPVVRWQQDRK